MENPFIESPITITTLIPDKGKFIEQAKFVLGSAAAARGVRGVHTKGGIAAENDETESKSVDEVATDIDLFSINEKLEPKPAPAEEITDDLLPEKTTIKHVENVHVFPEDRIIEFKEKIFIATGIPPYKQHLFYKRGDIAIPLIYKVVAAGRMIININNLWSSRDRVLDIPIDQTLFKYKGDYKIEALDSITTVQNVYDQSGTTNFYVVNIDSFLEPLRGQLAIIMKSDSYQFQLFYYSFVLKYWPMFTTDVFQSYVDESVPISTSYPKLHPNLKKIKEKYDIEADIINRKYSIFSDISKPKIKKYRPHLATGQLTQQETKKKRATDKYILDMTIKFAVISVSSNGENNERATDLRVNVRNLFDVFLLEDEIPFTRVKLWQNYKGLVLTKIKIPKSIYDTSRQREKTQSAYDQLRFKTQLNIFNSILFAIKTPGMEDNYILLTIFEGGHYSVKSFWDEESKMDFYTLYEKCKNAVNPIIKKINSFGRAVFYGSGRLPEMRVGNSEFTNLCMNVIWKYPLLPRQFDVLKTSLQEDARSGIIKNITFGPINEFYFYKGTTEHDVSRIEQQMVVDNYYSYLSDSKIYQKWENLFERGRNTLVLHRSTDVKFVVQGLKEREFTIFYQYLVSFLYNLEDKMDVKTTKVAEDFQDNNLRLLKNRDPELFSFKQYGSKLVYSRLCQKNHQPRIYSESEISMLPDKIKKGIVKYWNFTARQEAYYHCPDSKYPYLNFITGKHPLDYCIPCCKKTPSYDYSLVKKSEKDLLPHPLPSKKIARVGIKKHNMYFACLEKYSYKEEEEQIKLDGGSRYVMNYGKDIDIGRIGKLPDALDKYLLYNLDITPEKKGDEQKIAGFYLFGISQNNNNLNNIGAVFSIANSMGLTIEELVSKTIEILKDRPEFFKMLLNGNLPKHFITLDLFIRALNFLFIDNKMKLEKDDCAVVSFNKWNKLFIDIAKICFKRIVISFDDMSLNTTGTSIKITSTTKDNIQLSLPSRIRYVGELIPGVGETSKYKYIILLRRRRVTTSSFQRLNWVYYPIFKIVPRIYFKNFNIQQRIYSHKEELLGLIRLMIDDLLKRDEEHKFVIDLNIMNQFIESNKKWEIKKLFINRQNMCYALLLQRSPVKSTKKTARPGGKYVYLPIEYSNYESEKQELDFDTFIRGKYDLDYRLFREFMNEYNRFVVELSASKYMFKPEFAAIKSRVKAKIPYRILEKAVVPIFPLIRIEKILLLRAARATRAKPEKSIFKVPVEKHKIIGFVNRGLYHYFNAVSLEKLKTFPEKSSILSRNKALDPSKVKFLYYDPDFVNGIIGKDQTKLVKDKRIALLERSVYEKNLYKMFVLELMDFLDSDRNVTSRAKIKKLILDTNFRKNFSRFQKEMDKILGENENTTDREKIREIVTVFYTGHFDKKKLLEDIKYQKYDFDKVTLIKIRNLAENYTVLPGNEKKAAKAKIRNIISSIADKIFKIGNIKFSSSESEVSTNILNVCRDAEKSSYCDRNRLIISRADLNSSIDILTDELLDPIKRQALLASIFMDNILNEYQYKRRPDEELYVQFC